VQVKSGGQVDVKVVNELQGAFDTHWSRPRAPGRMEGADQARSKSCEESILQDSSWGCGSGNRRGSSSFEGLSSEIQAELPLKRIWTIVTEQSSPAEA
jgi:hypothetical protein